MKLCEWCQLHPARRRFCSRRCRQAAFRCRCAMPSARFESGSLTHAYADPPYPGLSRKYYSDQLTYQGEVNHAELLQRLEDMRISGQVAGWALSTSSDALPAVLAMVPPTARPRVCSWHKHVSPVNGLRHDFWEPLIVVPGRPWRAGFQNVLEAATARGGQVRMVGRKPLAFCHWLFEALGMAWQDQLLDMFPGTGGVTSAWTEISKALSAQAATPRRIP